MRVLLSVVSDVFDMQWGVTVAPGIPRDGRRVRVTVGDVIEIRPPKGTAFQAKVRGLPMGGRQTFLPITLDLDIKADMVPMGSEIWISETSILADDSPLPQTVR